MIVRLGMAPRRDGLDFEEFQRHWRASHADVVSHLPGLRGYVQFHAVLREGRPLEAYPGFDACSALVFDSVVEMDAAFDSQQFTKAVQADEQDLVDKSRFHGVVGTWRSPDGVAKPDGLGSFVAVRLWRSVNDAGMTELIQSLTARRTGPTAFLVTDHAAHQNRFPSAADLVEMTGLDETDDDRASLGSLSGPSGPSSGEMIGIHVSRPFRVV